MFLRDFVNIGQMKKCTKKLKNEKFYRQMKQRMAILITEISIKVLKFSCFNLNYVTISQICHVPQTIKCIYSRWQQVFSLFLL